MKVLAIILFFVLPGFQMRLSAQNFVANPSFERISSCPDDFFQIYKAAPWFSPNCEPLRPDRHGYAILFTSISPCASDLTGVPKNVWCSQYAHTGYSYAGIEIVSTRSIETEYRQYLEAKLQSPLEAGKNYLFSMFYSLCYYTPVSSDIICFKTNNLGAYFSENLIDKNPNCQVLPVSPQVHDAGRQISPSSEWHELAGCFMAKGNENYITIGNFVDNIASNCSAVDSIGYYLFIDDVTVIAEVHKQVDTVICNSKDWSVNAKQLRNEYTSLDGWKYKWDDGSDEIERKFTTPGNYTLTVTNKDCFTDTYNFKIEFSDCACKNFTPNAFTPNGDKVNDKFIPRIICQTQELSEYKFSIFNRWGARIFVTSSQTQAWDGTYMGKPVTTGNYVYVVEYKARSSQQLKTIRGTVLALR